MIILYIHGFGSSGNSNKVNQLKTMFGESSIIAPTLTHNPLQDINCLMDIITSIRNVESPLILVGSSLGGFYAYYLSVKYNLPAILINPSFKPHLTLMKYGNIECSDGREIKWTKNQTNELYELLMILETRLEINDNNDKLYFFISKDDQLLDHSNIKLKYRNVREFDNCGHEFSRFSEIIPEIQDICQSIVS